MKSETKEIRLKDVRTAVFRAPSPADAAEMIDYLKKTSGETHFLLRTPEEVTMTVEDEAIFLQNMVESKSDVMIICTVDGKLAGNCRIARKTRTSNLHRGVVMIALLEEFWGLGIGTAMFEELIAIGKSWGLMQLELEVIEGNHRAIALYRKMGFETFSYVPNAIRLTDGTLLKEFYMVKPL